MKKEISIIEANPSKRIYRPIISDYDLNKAFCELIDNSLDIWIKNGKSNKVKIDIVIDERQQSISITDNVGGLKHSELKYIVAPGHSSNNDVDETIGIFGVGSKRAVVHLAENIKITTHHPKDKTYRVEYDNEWLEDETTWNLPVYEVNEISKGTTVIELSNLRYKIIEEDITDLKNHLGETYALFLKSDDVEIIVNGFQVKSKGFEKWAYPPNYMPQKMQTQIKLSEGTVRVEVRAGLSTISSPAGGEYGVYFYCNDRLIVKHIKDSEVGFLTGYAGLPHPSVSLARVFVYLAGPAKLMPWNSSKSNINYNHPVFVAIKSLIMGLTKQYARLSRSLEGKWDTDVFQFNSGRLVVNNVSDINSALKIRLPEIPRQRFSVSETIINANKKIGKSKPWTVGLYESIAAAEIVYGKSFAHKNRIALIVLDSTLEIGLKEYLVAESGGHYTDAQLLSLFNKRHLVINEVKKYILGGTKYDSMWSKVAHYYRLRNKLIHQTASIKIDDEDILDYKKIVEKILSKLFSLKFI